MSSGPFDSLNLGRLTDDAPENVAKNRRRLGEAVGHPWSRFCYGRQVHGATVRRATEPPSEQRPYTHEDGQATALTDAAAIVFVADCLPVLLAAEGAVAALHCGWKPLAANIVEEGIAALREVGGTGPITAALGPSARGCCYEVGEEVHAHFTDYDARRGERNLDIAAVARPAARGARHRGRSTSACARSATSASSATAATRASPAARRGHMPRLITGLDAAKIAANLERVKATIADAGRDPATLDILAAVKYVPIDEIGTLQRGRADAAGREPRAGARGQGDASPGLPLALHRPAAVAQGQADPAVRRADPLGRVRVGAAPTRAARDAGDRDPARGQRRRRGGQGGYRP